MIRHYCFNSDRLYIHMNISHVGNLHCGGKMSELVHRLSWTASTEYVSATV